MKVPERYRIGTGPLASTRSDGNNGAFLVPASSSVTLNVIASDDGGWEHCSVTVAATPRCPTWEEMTWVRDLFWSRHVTVVQFHPPASEYVNAHPFCLHLWRQPGVEVVRPPARLVGGGTVQQQRALRERLVAP